MKKKEPTKTKSKTKSKTKKPTKVAACNVRPHFTCDGTGQMCAACGESQDVCGCDEGEFENCKGCDGAAFFCTTHDSPCGDLRTPPRCDVAQGKPLIGKYYGDVEVLVRIRWRVAASGIELYPKRRLPTV